MGIVAAPSSPPEPTGASLPPPPPTTVPVNASAPPPEAAAPPPPPTTEAADLPDKVDAAAGAGADGAAETVVVDVSAEAGKNGDEEEEEEGECGFCLFMKGGGCKEEFVAWEKCVEEAETAGKKDDVVERCHDATAALRKCMDAHADYYEPILRAERAMAEDLDAAQAREATGSEPGASLSSEAPEPARTSEEEGQKKQANEAAGSDKKNGDSAA